MGVMSYCVGCGAQEKAEHRKDCWAVKGFCLYCGKVMRPSRILGHLRRCGAHRDHLAETELETAGSTEPWFVQGGLPELGKRR